MHSEVALEDLFTIGSSKRVLKSQWKTDGIPFYRGREITRLARDGYADNELYISEELYSEYSEKYGTPKSGDIVITAIGTIGNSYIVREEDEFYFKDASVLWLKKNTNTSSEFINLWFQSPFFKEQLDQGNGATVDTLTISKLKSIVVNLPPQPEQLRIVAILDEAFSGLSEACGNATKNLQNARDLFENYLHSVFTKGADGWISTTLGELCESVEYGTSAKSKALGKVAVLRMGNIQNRRFDWDNLVYTDDDKEIEKYLLKHNDVLFNRTNSPELVGKTAIYKSEMPAIFAGYLIRINRKENLLDADYLNYYLNSRTAINYGKTVVISSVNQANINGKKLKSYPISVPSMKEQKSIVEKITALHQEVQTLESIYKKKLNILDELKQSLLHKAFSGNL